MDALERRVDDPALPRAPLRQVRGLLLEPEPRPGRQQAQSLEQKLRLARDWP